MNINKPLLCAGLLLACSATARAELLEIRWDANQRFEQRLSVAPGKFAEVCGPLAKGQVIAWSFRADQAQDFNIHYHETQSQVVYPERRKQVTAADGRLEVALGQDYCWMWSNKSGKTAALELRLQRQP
jgi:hypothetical protein